jgi:hypothetical protein
MKTNTFSIDNSNPAPLELYLEPEGLLFVLAPRCAVEVIEEFNAIPLTLRTGFRKETGAFSISVWSGDGSMSVTYRGTDVMTAIIANGGIARSQDMDLV